MMGIDLVGTALLPDDPSSRNRAPPDQFAVSCSISLASGKRGDSHAR